MDGAITTMEVNPLSDPTTHHTTAQPSRFAPAAADNGTKVKDSQVPPPTTPKFIHQLLQLPASQHDFQPRLQGWQCTTFKGLLRTAAPHAPELTHSHNPLLAATAWPSLSAATCKTTLDCQARTHLSPAISISNHLQQLHGLHQAPIAYGHRRLTLVLHCNSVRVCVFACIPVGTSSVRAPTHLGVQQIVQLHTAPKGQILLSTTGKSTCRESSGTKIPLTDPTAGKPNR
eukprot:1139151-Pelagomonas_calceolata.AAC.3